MKEGLGGTYLQVAFGVEEQVLGFDIPMRDTLAVQVTDTRKDLLEAALDFGW